MTLKEWIKFILKSKERIYYIAIALFLLGVGMFGIYFYGHDHIVENALFSSVVILAVIFLRIILNDIMKIFYGIITTLLFILMYTQKWDTVWIGVITALLFYLMNDIVITFFIEVIFFSFFFLLGVFISNTFALNVSKTLLTCMLVGIALLYFIGSYVMKFFQATEKRTYEFENMKKMLKDIFLQPIDQYFKSYVYLSYFVLMILCYYNDFEIYYKDYFDLLEILLLLLLAFFQIEWNVCINKVCLNFKNLKKLVKDVIS